MLKPLIAVFALTIAVGACSDRPRVLTRMERLTAEVGARGYGEKAGADFIECFSTDTNADGFITCTLRVKASNELLPLACGYAEGSPGCKRLPSGKSEPIVDR